nr:fatty acid synthase [Kerria lacca]
MFYVGRLKLKVLLAEIIQTTVTSIPPRSPLVTRLCRRIFESVKTFCGDCTPFNLVLSGLQILNPLFWSNYIVRVILILNQ